MTNKDDNQRSRADQTARMQDDLQNEKEQQNTSKIDDEMNG